MDSKKLIEKLKKLVRISGDEILNEFVDKDGNFELVIKRGTYTVSIRYYTKTPWLHVAFPSPFKEEDILKIFDEQIKNPQFVFGLQSALTSPHTAYNFLINDKQRFIGFVVLNRIFLSNDNVSIKELDDAITSVVGVGALGFTFISHCIGDKKIEQRIIEDTSTPDLEHMFG